MITARNVIESAIAVTCAASFSIAIRRFPYGAAATRSRLPRRASPASVEESARIDHIEAMNAKNGPYLYVRKPPMVSGLTTGPAMPAMTAGSDETSAAISLRASAVPYALPQADPMASMNPERRPVMMRKASRESRSVFA